MVRYAGSPVSKGVFQPDMWGVTPTDRWNWAELRAEVAEHGVRNSLLVAPMPTASTAQILGNNESFEPYTSNMYNRRVLSGEFTIVNRYLLADLDKLGLWPKVKNQLIAHNGSVQRIAGIPVRAPHPAHSFAVLRLLYSVPVCRLSLFSDVKLNRWNRLGRMISRSCTRRRGR